METELFPSVYITDGKIPSVIPLLFSGFLVVSDFGWGMPIKVETPSIDKTGSISICNMVIGFINDYPKKISMQEKADGRGGIEIGFVLLKHKMEIFNSLFVDGTLVLNQDQIASGEQQYENSKCRQNKYLTVAIRFQARSATQYF